MTCVNSDSSKTGEASTKLILSLWTTIWLDKPEKTTTCRD